MDLEPIRTCDAALLVHRSPVTIRQWAYLGYVRRVGQVGRQATWNRSDVLATEADLAAGRRPTRRRDLT